MKYMTNQITKILPKSDWQSITIVENNDPVVDIKETERLILGKNIAPYIVEDYKIRKTVYEMLCGASLSLPTGYKLTVIEGIRSIQKQQRHWDNKILEFKRLHPEWSDEELEYQVRLVVAKPLPLANHNCGGAVDVTLIDEYNNVLDMGTRPQDLLERENVEMFSKLITQKQEENRKILREAMENVGFVWYPGEWWHYCYGDRMWAVYSRKKVCFYGPIKY